MTPHEMSAALLYFLFFCSGVSGLVYQVIWVREFGNVFGNTVYSASLVVAIFMLGLGVGSCLLGLWADRRYATAPESLLRAYGHVELLIGGLGLAITFSLPSLGALSGAVSSYEQGVHGWFLLTPMSYLARAGIAVALLTPITVLMGGTLTLLIRHLVRQDVETTGASTIAVLYGVNTAGAAAGAFLTDFALVPAAGLRATQLVAVALNVMAGVGALLLARRQMAWASDRLKREAARPPEAPASSKARKAASSAGRVRDGRPRPDQPVRTRAGESARQDRPAGVRDGDLAAADAVRPAVVLTSLALALSGFAAMGLEILWLRHFSLLLGGFRAVFSLLLTVMLVGIGVGSLVGGAINRRTAKPAQALMLVQALLVASALVGLSSASLSALMVERRAIETTLVSLAPWKRLLTELWYNARPILIEAGVPALLMGCSYPLGNAVVQHTERAVGRRAGVLYLANTAGTVCGSLVAAYVLLPALGIQGSATWLMAAGGVAMAPLCLAARARQPEPTAGAIAGGLSSAPARSGTGAPAIAVAAAVLAAGAMAVWTALPPDYVLRRSLAPQEPGERLLEVSEGVAEIIAVTEVTGRGRALMTNGHPMSSTARLDQRYMRALAHIPLLSMDRPERVLVIGFGVGNTTHAATLHPSVRRVEVADLSAHVLEHSAYFRDANGGVLDDPRVAVYVNDGRQHLQMQPEGSYDLITLEPPPIAQAGVAALYSREFYALARSRLKRSGYISQWLPAYQVPGRTSLAMVRAFVDVFPESVLLSGTQAELLLLGTAGAAVRIDPIRVADALEREPDVAGDLHRLDLGTVTEIVGTFVSSSETLARATRDVAPVTDDRPLQEYSVRSALRPSVLGVPASIFNLAALGVWCPQCFDGDRPAPAVAGLDTYLALLGQAYTARAADVIAAASARGEARRILGSAYLGTVLPDTADVHVILGLAHLRNGRHNEAIAELQEALQRDPDSAAASRNLGTVLASVGRGDEALGHLRRAVQLDPEEGDAQYELGSVLLERRQFADAADHLRAALRVSPDSAAAHNDLGIALASMGHVSQAIDHFTRAVTLRPDFTEARRNLTSALQARRAGGSR